MLSFKQGSKEEEEDNNSGVLYSFTKCYHVILQICKPLSCASWIILKGYTECFQLYRTTCSYCLDILFLAHPYLKVRQMSKGLGRSRSLGLVFHCL